MENENEKLKRVVCDTIGLLCQKGLTFYKFLKIEGVIGVTADDNKFVIHIDQVFDTSNVANAPQSEMVSSNFMKREEMSSFQQLNNKSIKTEPPNLHGQFQTPQTNFCLQSPRNKSQLNNKINFKQEIDNIQYNNLPSYNNSNSKIAQKESLMKQPHNNVNTTNQNINVLDQYGNFQQQNYNQGGFQAPVFKNQVRNDDPSPSTKSVAMKKESRNPCSQATKSNKSNAVNESQQQNSFSYSNDNSSNNANNNDEEFIIVECVHICGYPNCNKRFKYRGDLLKHQTKNHNRVPMRKKKSDGFDLDYDGGQKNEQFVIVEATHICGYSNCNKRFKYRGDLLKHQTKNHGRVPKRKKTNTCQPNSNEDSNNMDHENYGDGEYEQDDAYDDADYHYGNEEQYEDEDGYEQYQ